MGTTNSIRDKCEADLKEAWKDCERNSRSVEILYENEQNQKVLANVHFRFDPKVGSYVC